MTGAAAWPPGNRLYLLPFDHRGSFKKELFGLSGGQEPDPGQRARISDLKTLIYEGLEEALAGGAPRASAGVLVDEEFGTTVARLARAAGLTLAMPVERSGQEEFDLEYGDDFARHIEDFDPDFVKVLVRYNPEGDAAGNARQATRLASLSDWLRQRGRALLFELLVPPTKTQLAWAGGDVAAYEHKVLPGLVLAAMAALQEARVEPAIWKIQGLDDQASCERAVTRARAGGRDGVVCIVLGHRADDARVRHWLSEAAGVDGYVGFAVGRTVWFDALADHVAGRCDWGSARTRIAGKYQEMIDVYEPAAAPGPGRPAASPRAGQAWGEEGRA
ncbi:MAG: 2-deoxy-5-keto-D-gluconate 6-phosphate aldolase domain-containing protein [Streptosporangiaceae bacterium]